MKFAKYLDSHALPVWRSKYLSYKLLKHKVKDIHHARRTADDHGALPPSPVETDVDPGATGATATATASEHADETKGLLAQGLATSYASLAGGSKHAAAEPRVVTDAEEAFLKRFELELRKVERHYTHELDKAESTFSELLAQADELGLRTLPQVVLAPQTTHPWGSVDDSNNAEFGQEERVISGLLHDDQRFAYAVGQLKHAFHEFYRHLANLRSYQVLNYTACVKIMKKHDKNNEIKLRSNLTPTLMSSYKFTSPAKLDALIERTEELYADLFFHGDRKQAMKRLAHRRLPSHKQIPVWRIFRLGLYVGIILMAACACVLDTIARMQQHYRPWHNRSAWIMFRGLLVPCLMAWLCAVNVYVWNRTGINHQYVFELHPTKYLTFLDLFELTAAFSTVVSLALLLYLSGYFPQGHEHLIPLMAYGILALLLLNPLHIMHRSARWWLLRVLGRVVVAPLPAVNFADFWLADQFISLGSMFLDLEFTLCHYVHCALYPEELTSALCSDPASKVRAALVLMPGWFRLAQCLRRYRDSGAAMPHLVNAGKYLTGMVQTVFFVLMQLNPDDRSWGIARIGWVGWSIAQTVYSLAYDVRMDWGLNWPTCGGPLRAARVYGSGAYYVACFLDLVLRLAWVLRLLSYPQFIGGDAFVKSPGFLFTLIGLEMLRRFMWNFFRVENEYVNDCIQFHSLLAGVGIVRETAPEAAELNRETYATSRAEHTLELARNPSTVEEG